MRLELHIATFESHHQRDARLAVWADVEANAGERAVRVRERAPSIIEPLPNSSGREDDVRLLVFRPDLLIGLPKDNVASRIYSEQKQHQGRKAAHLIPTRMSWREMLTAERADAK